MSKRFLLAICLVTGLCVHGAVLFGLHKLPLKTHQRPFYKAAGVQQAVTEFFARLKRTESIAEIYNKLRESEPELKHAFHELHTEYAPALEIALETGSMLDLEVDPFSFEPDLHTASFDKGEVSLWEESRLISTTPLATTMDMPLFADRDFEDATLDCGTLANGEHFDVEVEYAPKRYRPGYVFKASFYPRSDVVFKRIRQNVFFLIDRSNSIPRARYALNKRVVAEALEYLKAGDTFNILIFDDKVVRFAQDAVPWNEETIAEARAFLDRQGHGGYFAATELYASLGKIIPQDVSDHEVNTAILLSDGDTYLSQEMQRQMIAGWTARNHGKVCLYSIASGTGNNLPLLDLLSSFNQGCLIYTQDHNELAPILVNLLRTIHSPIGKEIVATPVTADKQTTVILQPKAVRLPDLYQHRPFVVYGSVNRLSDFVLFLQGKYYDRRFDIKKTISFENAKIGSFSLERKWTQLLVYEYYAHYLEDGNPDHLEAAKQLLRPMNIPSPWGD